MTASKEATQTRLLLVGKQEIFIENPCASHATLTTPQIHTGKQVSIDVQLVNLKDATKL